MARNTINFIQRHISITPYMSVGTKSKDRLMWSLPCNCV